MTVRGSHGPFEQDRVFLLFFASGWRRQRASSHRVPIACVRRGELEPDSAHEVPSAAVASEGAFGSGSKPLFTVL